MISPHHENIYTTPSSFETAFCFPVDSFQIFLRYGALLLGYQKHGVYGHGHLVPLKTATAFRATFYNHMLQPLLHFVANDEFVRIGYQA